MNFKRKVYFFLNKSKEKVKKKCEKNVTAHNVNELKK